MGIITISRTHGSGGTGFAEELAAKLGYRFVNRAFITGNPDTDKDHMCAFGITDEESPSFLEKLKDLRSNRSYFKACLMADIYELALENNVVFAGMGAGIILTEISNVINIRVVRLLAERVKAIAQVQKISYDRALDLIHEMDRGKKDFISQYFEAHIDDPTLYHLVANSSYVSLEDGLSIISEYAHRHLTESHAPQTERLLRNRLLEKRSELLLFGLGMVASYGKVNFEAREDGILLVKGIVGGEEEKKALFEALNRNSDIKKIEDHLKIGVLSNLIY